MTDSNPDPSCVDQGVGDDDQLMRLWSPYRMSYIADRIPGDDPFETIPTMDDADGLIVARGEHVYCLLNLFPYNAGHMMVVPYRREANFEDLTAAESLELMDFVQHAIRTLKHVSNPHAVNVGLNLGRASGGSIAEHLHVHIVPRWSGDSNFLTITGGTKVMPQLLKDTRQLMADAWGEVSAQSTGSDTPLLSLLQNASAESNEDVSP